MKISIITVCFNSSETIEDSILSVLSQNYDNIEYVVIDGGSTDGTLDILEKYQDRIAKCISEPDDGLYDAMNKGAKLATGDVIAFLNSDDFYTDKNIVGGMMEFIKSDNLGAAYGDVVYVKQNNINQVVRSWKTGEYIKDSFRHGWVIPHPAFFCKRKYFERYGFFESDFKIAADFELMLRFIEVNQIRVGYLPKTIVTMRSGGAATTIKGIARGNLEIMKSLRMNGMRLSASFFFLKPALKLKQLICRKVSQ